MNQHDRNEIQHDVYISLKEHFNALRTEQDRRIDRELVASRAAVDAALVAAKEAVNKAEMAQERRLDLLNEFRQQSVDEQRKFVSRETFGALADDVERLETSQNRLYGGLLVLALVGVANLVKLFFG